MPEISTANQSTQILLLEKKYVTMKEIITNKNTPYVKKTNPSLSQNPLKGAIFCTVNPVDM